jgi:hypothetical protein
MHEVAEASSIAFAILVLTTAGLSEISHRRQFSIKWSTCRNGPISRAHEDVKRKSTYLHTSVRSSCQQRLVLLSPTRTAHKHFQSNGRRHCHTPCIENTDFSNQRTQAQLETNSHAIPTNAQTSTAHSIGPHTLHQIPLVVPSPSTCIRDRGLGCDTRWEGG